MNCLASLAVVLVVAAGQQSDDAAVKDIAQLRNGDIVAGEVVAITLNPRRLLTMQTAGVIRSFQLADVSSIVLNDGMALDIRPGRASPRREAEAAKAISAALVAAPRDKGSARKALESLRGLAPAHAETKALRGALADIEVRVTEVELLERRFTEIDGARRRGGHAYKFYSRNMHWQQARDWCESVGGHLVTIRSPQEWQFVRGLAPRDWGRVWIGLTDAEREGAWQWVTGEPFRFAAWNRGEPNEAQMGLGPEDCAAIDTRAGAWVDLDTFARGSRNGFICEWEPLP